MSTDTRKALWHATFRGDATDAVGNIVGPNGFGEHLVAIDAQRADDGSTRVGFAIATVPDIEAARARFLGLVEQAEAHPALFVPGGAL